MAPVPKAPALLLGLGLGGFVDGIVLHQVLQWHHMLTGEHGGESMKTVAGLEANTLPTASSTSRRGSWSPWARG